MPTGSLKKIWRRTPGANCALWRKVLIPIARHHPVEPSARATSSITCSVVTMSAPSPPSASGSVTLNTRALAMSMTRSAGSFRAASISAARFRILGASPRATSNGVVAAGTVSVIMVLTSRERPLAPGNPAPAAGAPSRSLCHKVDVQNHLVLVLDDAQQGAVGRVAEAALLELQLGATPELGALHAHLGRKLELVRDAGNRAAASCPSPFIALSISARSLAEGSPASPNLRRVPGSSAISDLTSTATWIDDASGLRGSYATMPENTLAWTTWSWPSLAATPSLKSCKTSELWAGSTLKLAERPGLAPTPMMSALTSATRTLNVQTLRLPDRAVSRERPPFVLEPEQRLHEASAAEGVREHRAPVPEQESRPCFQDGPHVADLHPALRPPAEELDLVGRHVLAPDDGGRPVVLLEVLTDDEPPLAELPGHGRPRVGGGVLDVGVVHPAAGEGEVGFDRLPGVVGIPHDEAAHHVHPVPVEVLDRRRRGVAQGLAVRA